MAEILAAVPGLAGAGVGGLLLLLVMYLLKANRDDRQQHRETVAAFREEHRREVADLETKIDRLEQRIDDLHKAVDVEREQRREAQDAKSRAETRAAAAEATLRQVTGGVHGPATSWLPPPASNHRVAPETVAVVNDPAPGGPGSDTPRADPER